MDIAKTAKESLLGIFKIKDINSDNVTFKLFYKASFGLCLFSCLLVAATQYWGNPINCSKAESGGVDLKTFESHCWIHGTQRIEEAAHEHLGCNSTVPGSNVTFYQWVTFMLLINAAIFRIPYIIWKFCEGGLMKKIFSDGRGKKDDVSLEKRINKEKGKMGWYYFTFVLCQLLNVGMLVLNCLVTNALLNGNFALYGSKVTSQYLEPVEGADPLCSAFPTVTSCKMNTFGTAMGETTTSGVCILSQNIINQKIYLVLWFWFIIMFAIGILQILFEMLFICLPSFRIALIAVHMDGWISFFTGKLDTQYVRKCVGSKVAIGYGFLLYQMGKNMDEHEFRSFLECASPRGPRISKGENQEMQTFIENGNERNPNNV